MRTWCYSSFSLISLNILITCLQKMYGYYREKFQVNHLWEIRVKSWLLPVDHHLQDLLLPSCLACKQALAFEFHLQSFFHTQLLITALAAAYDKTNQNLCSFNSVLLLVATFWHTYCYSSTQELRVF